MASADGVLWQELYGEHAEAVRRKLEQCAVARADIEDLLQTVFLVAFRRRDVLPTEPRAARCWLLELARRHAANWRNLARRSCEVLDARAIDEARAMPEDPEAHAELVDALRVALGRLDERDREVLLWRFVDGETFGEIGRRIGLRKSGAEVRVVGARRKFLHSVQVNPCPTLSRKRGEGHDIEHHGRGHERRAAETSRNGRDRAGRG